MDEFFNAENILNRSGQRIGGKWGNIKPAGSEKAASADRCNGFP